MDDSKDELRGWSVEDLATEVRRLRGLINTPQTGVWTDAVPLEAAHQVERWGSEHDSGKTPFDWFWLIGYLAQKAAAAAVAGDVEKAKHHTISTGAALLNWHRAMGDEPRTEPHEGEDQTEWPCWRCKKDTALRDEDEEPWCGCLENPQAISTPLDEASKEARRPPPPDVLADAKHDTVHVERGRGRAARTAAPSRANSEGDVLAEALAVINDLVDDEECVYDHHGYCQTHRLHPAPCPNETGLRILAMFDDDRDGDAQGRPGQ